MNYKAENKGISTIQKSPLRGDLEGLPYPDIGLHKIANIIQNKNR